MYICIYIYIYVYKGIMRRAPAASGEHHPPLPTPPPRAARSLPLPTGTLQPAPRNISMEVYCMVEMIKNYRHISIYIHIHTYFNTYIYIYMI